MNHRSLSWRKAQFRHQECPVQCAAQVLVARVSFTALHVLY